MSAVAAKPNCTRTVPDLGPARNSALRCLVTHDLGSEPMADKDLLHCPGRPGRPACSYLVLIVVPCQFFDCSCLLIMLHC